MINIICPPKISTYHRLFHGSNNFDKIDKHYRKGFEKFCSVDSLDETIGNFTEDQQIERYAKAIAFWNIELDKLAKLSNKNKIIKERKSFANSAHSSLSYRIHQIFDTKIIESIANKAYDYSK